MSWTYQGVHDLIYCLSCTAYARIAYPSGLTLEACAGAKMSSRLKQQSLGGTACLELEQMWGKAVRFACNTQRSTKTDQSHGATKMLLTDAQATVSCRVVSKTQD